MKTQFTPKVFKPGEKVLVLIYMRPKLNLVEKVGIFERMSYIHENVNGHPFHVNVDGITMFFAPNQIFHLASPDEIFKDLLT